MASLLALLSSALWGTADFFGGKLSKKYPAFVVLGAQQFFGFLTGVILVVATGAWSAQALGNGGYLIPGIIAGFTGYGGLVCLYAGLSTGRMGVVSPISALAAIIPLGYALIYTAYLKRATPQNIVIGGLAGAMPPLLGWTAVTNQFHGHALLLVIIIFLWTPPHFWALAIHRRAEYAKVDIPMLPVTHGVEFTKTCILLYTILLAMACLLPVLVGMSGPLYFVCSSILSTGFIYKAWQLKYQDREGLAMQVFRFSIYHLMLLFMALLLDHYLWA